MVVKLGGRVLRLGGTTILFGYVLVEHILQWILFVVGMICVDTFCNGYLLVGYVLYWRIFLVGMIGVDTIWLNTFCIGHFLLWI